MEKHDHQALIRQLLDCAAICEHCAEACMLEENVKHMISCIRLDRDCADICTQAARLLMRTSVIAHQYLQVCEEICRLCAAECARHDHNHCRECARICAECADSCQSHSILVNVN